MKTTFKDFLRTKFAEFYRGRKDDMLDRFESWLVELEVYNILKYGEEYGEQQYELGLEDGR
jgi:hypothetical protein